MVDFFSPKLWIIIAIAAIVLTFIGIYFNVIFGSKKP